MVSGFHRFLILLLVLFAGVLPCRAASLVEGDIRDFPWLVLTRPYEDSPVLIFRDQISAGTKDFLRRVSHIIFVNSSLSDLAIDISSRRDFTSHLPMSLAEAGRYQVFYDLKHPDAERRDKASSDAVFYVPLERRVLEKGRHTFEAPEAGTPLTLVREDELEKNELELRALLDDRRVLPVYLFSKRKGSFYVPDTRGPVRMILGLRLNANVRREGEVLIDGKTIPANDFLTTRDPFFFRKELILAGGWHAYEMAFSLPEGFSFVSIECAGLEGSASIPPPAVTFRRVHPAKFTVHIRDAHAPFWLILGERFYDEWKLYPASGFDATYPVSGSGVIQSYPGQGAVELRQSHDFHFNDAAFLFRPHLRPPHVRVNGFANGWFIDPEKMGLGKDITLTIFFWPQALFCFMLGFTCVLSIASLAVLLFSLRKQ